MEILKYNDETFSIEPTTEILTNKYFKKIWDKKNKELALAELAFIYYMSDIRSQYFVIDDGKVRQATILNDDIIPALPKKYVPSIDVLKAIQYYKDIQDKDDVIQVYKTARRTVGKIRLYLENLDFSATTKTGTLLNDPKSVSSVLKDLRNLTNELRNAEIDVYTSRNKEDEYVGGTEKSILEG